MFDSLNLVPKFWNIQSLPLEVGIHSYALVGMCVSHGIIFDPLSLSCLNLGCDPKIRVTT
jgi:hypothetical protein